MNLPEKITPNEASILCGIAWHWRNRESFNISMSRPGHAIRKNQVFQIASDFTSLPNSDLEQSTAMLKERGIVKEANNELRIDEHADFTRITEALQFWEGHTWD